MDKEDQPNSNKTTAAIITWESQEVTSITILAIISSIRDRINSTQCNMRHQLYKVIQTNFLLSSTNTTAPQLKKMATKKQTSKK